MSKLILASGSPRRKEILMSFGFEFTIRKVDFDERVPEAFPANEVAEFLALKKNAVVPRESKHEVILTADTVVILNNEVLGKPANQAEAKEMLTILSDSSHDVITGVCISNEVRKKSFSSLTKVIFHPLTSHEIDYYIDTFQPYDKAGAYGIQEWIGHVAIESIEGSFYNVMGMPSNEVYRVLTDTFDLSIGSS